MSARPCAWCIKRNIALKLALGTVQFGLPYGIANQAGQTSKSEAQHILRCARNAGIDTLDTAIGYGDSEAILGGIGVNDWAVISKLPAIPPSCSNVTEWVISSVQESLGRLNISSLSAILLHRANQLLEEHGFELYRALVSLKEQGLVDKIGISIYEPEELDAILPLYQMDLIQAPFNVFDQRLIKTKWISRLKDKGVELHVRSAFLQGLLLMKGEDRPQKFDKWNGIWECYDNWLLQNNLSRLQACIRYPLSFDGISRVIIGVENQLQLNEIITASIGSAPSLSDGVSVDDIELINPAFWPEL